MSKEIAMPKLSDTMEEGKVLAWRVQPGDAVKRGDIIAEIETDKANIELESFDEGVIDKLLVNENETVAVGKPIALLTPKGEARAEVKPAKKEPAVASSKKAEAKKAEAEPVVAAPKAEPKAEPKPVSQAPEPRPAEASAEPTIRVSPIARRIAQERGIDLSQVQGSGPGGRIVERDVEAATAPKETPHAQPEAPPVPAEKLKPSAEAETVQLSLIRKTLGRTMTLSKQTIPHIYVTREIWMDEALKLRESLNRLRGEQGKVSINDLIVKAAALALRKTPQLNSKITDDGAMRFKEVHLGIAVALEDGLVVPVLRNADKKSLLEIADESRELIARGRARRLKPEEYAGATFTVTNLGAAGVESFAAIINPPQAGILAVAAVRKVPAVVNDQVAIRSEMKVTLSADHRLVDGLVAAQYLNSLKEILENPVALMVDLEQSKG